MLSGSLDTFTLPDVLAFVAKAEVTGRVEVTRDELAGELSIDRGTFVSARLAEDDAPSTVDEALDVAVLLFDGSSGRFELVAEDWVGGPLSLDADALVAAVERRREEWAEVVAVLGSLEDPLTLVSDLPDGTGEITIKATQWRLISLVDGERSVQDVARDAATSVYQTAVALAELAKAGMITQTTSTSRAKPKSKGAPEPVAEDEDDEGDDDDAAEVLAELADDGAQDKDREAVRVKGRPTVRPLRAPTREEQRIRLRR